MTDLDDDRGTTHICTSAQAKSLIRKNRTGRRTFIHTTTFLPTSEGRGFEYPSNVPVPAKTAIAWVGNTLSKTLEERGARIKVQIFNRCIFVG